MKLVNLTINGKAISVERNTTILDAAKSINVKIPTLCHFHMEDIKLDNKCASCRVCMVDTKRGLVPACATNVSDGMEVTTNTKRALDARKTVVELLLSDHPQDCLVCDKNNKCELQKIAADLGIRQIKYIGQKKNMPLDESSASISKDVNKCILCRRCETVCNEVQTVGVLSGVNRGFETVVGTFFNADMKDTNCTFCGQCVAVCPTASLAEINNIPQTWELLSNKEKTVVVQVAPAVRVALGEEFGLEPGVISTGKMVSALRLLGFKYVFDTNCGADFTIMEEASEFIHRFQENHNLPILTSCCPGWVKFFEHNYSDLLHLPSSCKSPQNMFGALAKGYFSTKIDKTPEEISVVSVMPCIAKKYEADREELSCDGQTDIDLVITTRELAKMIKEAGIDLVNLEEDNFDNPLGESTGAAAIFGTSGGVLEAALRTAYEWVTNKTLENVDFQNVRGLEGIKEAVINIDGTEVNVAAVSGLGNARKVMDALKNGECKYHIIEVMACPGGCIGGAGQPYHFGDYNIVKKRSQGLYNIDSAKELRKSHENPAVLKVYDEFLGKPYGETAHKYLHTHYVSRADVYENKEAECTCSDALAD